MVPKIYCIGDKLSVRKDLVPDRKYGGILFVKSMQAFSGDIVEIEEVTDLGFPVYKICGCPYCWTGEMFEKIEKISDEEKLKTLNASVKLLDMLNF